MIKRKLNARERVYEIFWLRRKAVQDNVWFAVSFRSFVFLLRVFITEALRLFSPAINTSPCIALSFPSFVLLSSRSASRHFNWASPAACDCLTLGFQINMLNISSATPLHYRPDTSSPAPSFLTCCTARALRYDRLTISLLFSSTWSHFNYLWG